MDATSTRDGRIAAVASLDQPVRRLLYDLLAARDAWTSRDEAASALDVPRSVAAFHLDKLADAGVVAVTFERTSGRAGPGAGRPAKLYRLVADEVSASMPDRHYDLAGQLLAAAVVESTASGVPVDESLHRIAREAGRTMAHEGEAATTSRARTSSPPSNGGGTSRPRATTARSRWRTARSTVWPRSTAAWCAA